MDRTDRVIAVNVYGRSDTYGEFTTDLYRVVKAVQDYAKKRDTSFSIEITATMPNKYGYIADVSITIGNETRRRLAREGELAAAVADNLSLLINWIEGAP